MDTRRKLLGLTALWLVGGVATLAGRLHAAPAGPVKPPVPPEELVLNYHLMHPGGNSAPGDPNAAFHVNGTYHLHYILGHEWKKKSSFSFLHVTSPDMLHWTWQRTSLQPSFTGHGMFSGTGLMTKEGKPWWGHT